MSRETKTRPGFPRISHRSNTFQSSSLHPRHDLLCTVLSTIIPCSLQRRLDRSLHSYGVTYTPVIMDILIPHTPTLAFLFASKEILYKTLYHIVKESNLTIPSDPDDLDISFALCLPPARASIEETLKELRATHDDLPIFVHRHAVRDMIAYMACVQLERPPHPKLEHFQTTSKHVVHCWNATVKKALKLAESSASGTQFKELLDNHIPEYLFSLFLEESTGINEIIMADKFNVDDLRTLPLSTQRTRGIAGQYLLLIIDPNDPEYLGVYIGQTNNLSER